VLDRQVVLTNASGGEGGVVEDTGEVGGGCGGEGSMMAVGRRAELGVELAERRNRKGRMIVMWMGLGG
jgi:hypothetical protein